MWFRAVSSAMPSRVAISASRALRRAGVGPLPCESSFYPLPPGVMTRVGQVAGSAVAPPQLGGSASAVPTVFRLAA
jgi:hypothetical protein